MRFLTYALVEEGLKQKKAAQNGQVELRHWLEYAASEVPPLQTAYMVAMKQKKNQDVGILDNDVAAKDPDPRTRTTQNPRAFFRREPDIVPFIVARP